MNWDNNWKALKEHIPRSYLAKRTHEFFKNKRIKTILDLGCGSGNDTIYFHNKGYDVTALDFSQKALDLLKKRNNKIKTLKQDITRLRIKNYDLIFANLSLHYFDLKTTQKIVNYLQKHCKYLVLRVKSIDDDLAKLGKKQGEFYNYKGRLRRLYSKKEIKLLISKFKIIKVRRTSSLQLTLKRGKVKSYYIEAIVKA